MYHVELQKKHKRVNVIREIGAIKGRTKGSGILEAK